MSEAMNYCDKCGSKIVNSVCDKCSISVTEHPTNGKSKLGVGMAVGVLIAVVAFLGFNWISNNSGSAGTVFSKVTKALDGCKGDAGCEFAKEALKSELFVIYEIDTYSILVSRCEQFVPSELVDNPDGNEDEVFAKTNWMVPCINVLYEEYQSKFGKTIANP
jgi:hypothetical protein